MAEVFRLGAALQDRIWPRWSQAPFAVLLVTPENEFLVRHPHPSADFIPIGHDSLLQSDVCYRPRTLDVNLLATFPAVGNVSTIVVGSVATTGVQNSTRWVLTLLHEHLHQWQDSQPDAYAAAAALGLAGTRDGGKLRRGVLRGVGACVLVRASAGHRQLTAINAAPTGRPSPSSTL